MTKPIDIGDLLRSLLTELLHDDADDSAIVFREVVEDRRVTLEAHVPGDVAGLLIGKGGTLCAALEQLALCASHANRGDGADRRAWHLRIVPDASRSARPRRIARTPTPLGDLVRQIVSATLDPADRDALLVELGHDGATPVWKLDGPNLRGMLLGRGGANIRAFDTIVQAVARARRTPKVRVTVTRDAPPASVHVRRPLTAAARV